MKKVLGFLLVITFTLPALAQTSATAIKKSNPTEKKGPVMKLEKMTHDFGTIREGDIPTYTFTFTNVGDAPLVITEIHKSCSCTEPKWSKEPIMPGQKGSITAGFNSLGRPGVFHRDLTIITNEGLPLPRQLFIKGDVLRVGVTDMD
jgi:hypothetical protein